MNKENSTLEILFGWIGTPFVLGAWLLGSVSYIWAVVIAFKAWGIIGSFITLCLPVIGQIYWTFRNWKLYSFDDRFVLVSVGCLICTFIAFIFVYLSGKYAKQ